MTAILPACAYLRMHNRLHRFLFSARLTMPDGLGPKAAFESGERLKPNQESETLALPQSVKSTCR